MRVRRTHSGEVIVNAAPVPVFVAHTSYQMTFVLPVAHVAWWFLRTVFNPPNSNVCNQRDERFYAPIAMQGVVPWKFRHGTTRTHLQGIRAA